MKQFSGNRVLITGAASGLGRELALLFAERKWQVAVTDLEFNGCQQVLAEVEAAGGTGLAFELDVGMQLGFAAISEHIVQQWGGLDIVINNAGIVAAGSIEQCSDSEWLRALNINLMGVVRGCRQFLPLLKQNKASHIVNIASFAAWANPPGMAAYNVSKAAVVSLSESLRAEAIDHGVGVTVVCPAFFPTNLMESYEGNNAAMPVMVNKMMQRSGVTAAEVAKQIYQAIDDNQFMLITHKDSRQQARLKRLLPNFFFKQVHKSTRAFMQ